MVQLRTTLYDFAHIHFLLLSLFSVLLEVKMDIVDYNAVEVFAARI